MMCEWMNTCKGNKGITGSITFLLILLFTLQLAENVTSALIQSVRMEMTGEVVSCSSQNIYPAPEVAWSTDPLSGPETLQNSTVKTPDSKGLYIVESRVRILGNVFDYAYFCSVISADKAQVWTTSIKKTEELIGEAGQELSIPCIAPQNLQNFSLTWTFSRTNDPTVILSYDSRTRRTSNLWVGRAGLKLDQVLMGDGSLFLHNPESREQTGTYTCTFTGFQSRHVVQTQVNIRSRSQLPVTEKMPKTTDQAERTGESHFQMLVIVVVVAVVVAAVITALLLYRKLRANQRQAGGTTVEDTEMQPTETIKTDDSPMDNCQLTEYHNNSYN